MQSSLGQALSTVTVCGLYISGIHEANRNHAVTISPVLMTCITATGSRNQKQCTATARVNYIDLDTDQMYKGAQATVNSKYDCFEKHLEHVTMAQKTKELRRLQKCFMLVFVAPGDFHILSRQLVLYTQSWILEVVKEIPTVRQELFDPLFLIDWPGLGTNFQGGFQSGKDPV